MQAVSHSQQRVFRFWAGTDLAVGLVLLLPPVAFFVLELLFSLERAMGGSGHATDSGALGLLLLCMLGGLIVTWAVARLYLPHPRLALIDATARLWVGGLILWFVVFHAVPSVVLVFVISEWLGGIHQAFALRKRD